MTSRGKAGSEPCARGRYYTAGELAEAVVRDLYARGAIESWSHDGDPIHVLEPSAGGGAFVRALRNLREETGIPIVIWAMDVDPTAAAKEWIDPEAGDRFVVADFLRLEEWPEDWPDRVDLVVGNPPYSIRVPILDGAGELTYHPTGHKKAGKLRTLPVEVGTDHTLRALELCLGLVAFVFRTDFRGSISRYARLWGQSVLESHDLLVPRPSFTGGGSDSTEYEAFYMRNGAPDRASSGWLVWKEA